MKKPTRTALGRGLSALISKPAVSIVPSQDNLARMIPEPAEEALENEGSRQQMTPGEAIRFVPISSIIPNPAQPRKIFVETEIKELAESIKNMGVLQPIIVRPASNEISGKYEIVAGERRWRACQIAGIEKVPVIIKSLSNWESLEIALVENVQRQNLNPVDEAGAYQALMDQYSLTQQDVADRIGKDRTTVANCIRLLKLSSEALNLLRDGMLSTGHAKALLQVKDPQAQARIAKKVVAEDLSVRALENLTAQAAVLEGQKQPAHKERASARNAHGAGKHRFPELVDKLRTALGTKVSILHQKSGRGKIEVEYFSEEDLDRLVEKLCE